MKNNQSSLGHEPVVPSIDIGALVQSGQIPLDVPILDAPYIKPVSLSEELDPINDMGFIFDCMDRGEDGDARLFARLYDGRIVFDANVERQWYFWKGHYWEPDELNLIKLLVHGPLASQYMHAAAMLKQCIDVPREENPYARFFPVSKGDLVSQIDLKINCSKTGLLARASKLRFKNKRNNVLDIAESLLAINNRVWDSNPWLLGCENGVLSLNHDDCWFRNGQPEDYIRTIAPASWAGIDCDTLMTWFVPSLFDNRPEKEKREITLFLRKLFGYGTTGLTREDTFCILWGDEGRNGKDTLLKIIEQTLGKEIAAPVDKAVIIDRKKKSGGGTSSHIMDLRGKRLVWVNETREGEVLSAGQVKYLTGGGTITGREIYQKQATFEASHLLLLLTNYKPHANADDKALWERISLVPFELRFVAEPKAPNERLRNPALKGQLTEEQKSGVLAYLVQGCLEWQRDGLLLPDCLKAAKSMYHEEEDTLGRFVADCCITGPRFRIDAKEFYSLYVEWVMNEGGKPMSNHAFGRKMKKRFKRKRSSKGNAYEGLKKKDISTNDNIF